MRFITGEEIRSVLTFEALIAAFEEGHARPPMEASDAVIGGDRAKYFVRTAGREGFAFGSKLITVVPENEAQSGLPSVQAVFLLFDGENGRPRCILDGTEMTYWKTAADSALGAKLLARADADTLLMVGAGKLAPWLVCAHLAVRPSIRRVLVWNRTAARARNLAEQLAGQGIRAEAVDDLEAAAGEAGIISTATMAQEPIIEGAWLASGTHLDLVGGWTPEMREADDDAVARARVFVDSRASAFDGVGDILIPIANGTIGEEDVLADLYDLMMGAAGRKGAQDVTLFKNAGGAHLDLMTAEVILRLVGAGGEGAA